MGHPSLHQRAEHCTDRSKTRRTGRRDHVPSEAKVGHGRQPRSAPWCMSKGTSSRSRAGPDSGSPSPPGTVSTDAVKDPLLAWRDLNRRTLLGRPYRRPSRGSRWATASPMRTGSNARRGPRIIRRSSMIVPYPSQQEPKPTSPTSSNFPASPMGRKTDGCGVRNVPSRFVGEERRPRVKSPPVQSRRHRMSSPGSTV